MNDDKLENLFQHIDDTPDDAARERARVAALQAFDALQDEQTITAAAQGSATGSRLTSEHQSFGRRIMQFLTANNPAQRWVYSGMASAAMLVLGVFLVLQLPQNSTRYLPSDVAVEHPAVPITIPPERPIEFQDGDREYRSLTDKKAYVHAASPPSPGSASDAADMKALNTPAPGKLEMSMSAAAAEANRVAPAASQMRQRGRTLDEVMITARRRMDTATDATLNDVVVAAAKRSISQHDVIEISPTTGDPRVGRDRFETVAANPIKHVSEEPVSTFSVDVDTASYSFVRRQLNQGVLPQKAAVRLEEMVNYFPYDYPLPQDRSAPFSTNVTVTDSPWKPGNKLVHIGIQGYEMLGQQARSNLVFLLDVSGSMNTPDKLPLVKQSMALLLDRLQPEDTVAIVVYAGAAGTVLEPTPVQDKQKILAALSRLQAGGSTAGAAGIQLAYQLAESQFIEDGVNRIILATDGDFNVGITNTKELKGFVERKRKSGVFLSVLGFGQGNYQDVLTQTLAQNGNGVAAYIDTLGEAQKVLVNEATSSLFPIAKDVKIQVEFNPATVSEYRLLGYETRMLAQEDFNNDAVDAGDIGAGHSVTAVYEITPAGSDSGVFSDSRYTQERASVGKSDEYGYLKLRYKLPDEDKSRLITQPISAGTKASPEALREARFATAVAGFAQLLQGGKYLADWNYTDVLQLAQSSRGDDPFGYRAEFIQLVRKAQIADAM